MPLRITSQSNLGTASPSVALEKGAYYRARTSHKRSTSSLHPQNPYLQRRIQPKTQQHTTLVAFLLLLIFACITCFGTAYYLFKTRWEPPARHSHILSANAPPLQANVYTYNDNRQIDPQELFLAYLPHSGFNNQRLALENALVLARLLNRTLIVPPIRLGNRPIPYYPFNRLSQTLASSDKTGLEHCTKVSPRFPIPAECLDYFEYTHVPWNWLVDLSSVTTKHIFQYRWNFTQGWFNDVLNIPDSEIFVLRDHKIYQYRFVDDVKTDSGEGRYLEDIPIEDLAQIRQRLLVFGSLFGSTRLRLENQLHSNIRKEIRETMAITHPLLIRISDSISHALDRRYLAMHFRAGDSQFEEASELNARKIWWTFMHLFNKSVDEITKLEEQAYNSIETNKITVPDLLKRSPLSAVERSLLNFTLSPWLPCRKSQSRIFTPIGLNTSLLYIATDLKNPKKSLLLDRFQSLFPCMLYLSDFEQELAPLNVLVNPDDGVPLRSHLLPFVDAMVAARAVRVVGTQGSTFSYYVENVLWKRFHNLSTTKGSS